MIFDHSEQGFFANDISPRHIQFSINFLQYFYDDIEIEHLQFYVAGW